MNATTRTSRGVVVDATTPVPAPRWALLERQLLDAQSRAIPEYYARYFDERGYLLCVPRWSGDDGPDDALENLLNWPALHALGAADHIMKLYRQGLEGHFRQYTEARTTEVALGRDGMYYQEFHVCFDWFHHGEAWSTIFLQGLTTPEDQALIRRMRRWTSWFMGDDPYIRNYDKQHRIIPSFFNGSRGPLMRKATALDWAGDPIEVEGRFDAGHGETTFEEMLDHFRDYTDVVGDNHVNLGATTLGVTSYLLTGEAKYREWVVDYLNAWVERTEKNGGLMPSSVGLDGTVESGYGWYGGVYGWGFTVLQVPRNGQLAHRAYHRRNPFSLANGLLLTGDRRYLSIYRNMLDVVNGNAKQENGQTRYPHMYGRLDRLERLQQGGDLDDLPEQGPEGWYEFRPEKFAPGADTLYYFTFDRSALDLLPETPRWLSYLNGQDEGYAEAALEADLNTLRHKVELMRSDTRSPDCSMSDDMNDMNPATIGALTQLMLGGLPTGRDVHVLHARLRYFDPANRRAGLPEHVAALVERMSADSVTVQLVNLDPLESKTVIVQGGAYGEHQITSVRVEGAAEPATVDAPTFVVRLGPSAGTRLVVGQQRFANQPTLAFPWV
ncbi:MAG: hypothetical protein IT306_18840 [Chloroflexi bacterium]|nr:hypothetical protein [Chloroflexota bacterium]